MRERWLQECWRGRGEEQEGKGALRTAVFSVHQRPTMQMDREIYYSPGVQEQTLDIPEIWYSGIYRLNIVYALVVSLFRKLQGSLLIKFKAGVINHIPQGMCLHGSHQTLHVGQGDGGCPRQL